MHQKKPAHPDRTVLSLIDTGFTTNLRAKHVFDQLSAATQQLMNPYADSHGILADGSSLPFYGVVELLCRVRNVMTVETFTISPYKKDAILGMAFLIQRDCPMKFNHPAMTMEGRDLECTDWHGWPAVESLVLCRVTARGSWVTRSRGGRDRGLEYSQ